MKLLSVSKPYSWLQWPVKISGYRHEAHVTAKFFGRAPVSPVAIERMLKAYSPALPQPSDIVWKPIIFNDVVHVLELTKCPARMRDTHELFSLLRDDFEPYKPHITVNAEYWHKVRNENLLAMNTIQSFGELELHLGTGDDAE